MEKIYTGVNDSGISEISNKLNGTMEIHDNFITEIHGGEKLFRGIFSCS